MARVSTGSDSKQDYRTPIELLNAVSKRFGPIVFDLAAHKDNKAHDRYYAPLHDVEVVEVEGPKGKLIKKEILHPHLDPAAEAQDALVQDWHKLSNIAGGILWLNPPFKHIDPWVQKCMKEASKLPLPFNTGITFLVPAAVGSVWYLKHMWGMADTYFLNGRVCFNGEPYPKDCMIGHFHALMSGKLFIWDWRHDKMYPTGDSMGTTQVKDATTSATNS